MTKKFDIEKYRNNLDLFITVAQAQLQQISQGTFDQGAAFVAVLNIADADREALLDAMTPGQYPTLLAQPRDPMAQLVKDLEGVSYQPARLSLLWHHNFDTHRDSWRKGIEHLSVRSDLDSDERAYWAHELKAFDEAFKYTPRLVNDAEINEITTKRIGQWPTFEAQSWACKVVHAVLGHGTQILPRPLPYRGGVVSEKPTASVGEIPSEQAINPKHLMRQADTLAKLRALCGFIENGSGESVTVAQDDATGWWTVYVGDSMARSTGKARSYSAQGFDEAIRKAAEAEGDKS